MRTLLLTITAALVLSGQVAPPTVPAGHVALPLGEYNRLVDLAAQAPKQLGAPPHVYALDSAEFKLRVEKESIAGTLAMQGEVLQKGAARIALASGLIVLDAQQSGRPLPLTQHDGAHSFVIEGPGEFNVQLECALAFNTEPGRARFTLPPVFAGAVRVTLSVPGEQTTVVVLPGLITAKNSNGGRTTIQATLVPGKATTVWWSARVPTATPTTPLKDLRFLSDVKTLVSVSETEIALTALADITVVQGEASRFEFVVPAGYEVTSVTGATLAATDTRDGRVSLDVASASGRSHQFLIAMAKSSAGGKAEVGLPGFTGPQRETGEVLVEGQGTLELAAQESGGLRRMDLRESSPPLRSLAGHSTQAAFRYQRRATETPALALTWVRFPSAPLVTALADQAIATTLVTREGRSLTEMRLTVRNESQAFVRVTLPPGSTILTADVAGQRVKPVDAPDGSRVPLMRPGFRPAGPYQVSFVFAHAGAPFNKKGSSEITLPRMDLPAGAIEWEIFLPAEFRVADFGGDVTPANLLARSGEAEEPVAIYYGPPGPGVAGGTVVDSSGAVIERAHVLVTHSSGQRHEAFTNAQGEWRIPALPAGRVTIKVSAPGFKTTVRPVDLRSGQPLTITSKLDVGAVSETVEIASERDARKEARQADPLRRQTENAASTNVMDLQKRLAGVLPIAVTVPRTGNSYRFVRPLVVDEETRLTFQYRAGK